MTPLELLACLIVGGFVGLGMLGVGYAIFALCATVWDALRPHRAVSVKLPANVHRYAQLFKRQRGRTGDSHPQRP